MRDVTINLDHIPFSRYGAYVSVNRDRKQGLFVIHNVERRFGEDEAFTLQFTHGGSSVDYTYEMRPDRITVASDPGARRSSSGTTTRWRSRRTAWTWCSGRSPGTATAPSMGRTTSA